ncbi:hypothetical protein D3OALGA1CA_1313 [Olavius algarvensis associated proteobacterium Delta 3]|nr:hypothetical protein D3OALGB2SA_615 [Olavius algarvensis associated proteobacterium Delta 3]CAB5099047.1 hypothetical protein D3OALGA1CA_1313 [Olavius algarvensis associated proteobacterium Delta 3]
MISVVIPVLNEAHTIGACLTHLQSSAHHLDIIVVDGGSTDDTVGAVRAFPKVTTLMSPRGRGCQMNSGATAARGDILFFLHADTRIPPNGLNDIEALMTKGNGIAGGSFSLEFDDDSAVLRFLARFTRINHILFTYGDQGLFVRRDVFRAIGGFSEIPLMEDVDIQRRLRRMGRFVKIRRPVTTSARRYRARGRIQQQLVNIILVAFYYGGVSPSRLKRYYR